MFENVSRERLHELLDRHRTSQSDKSGWYECEFQFRSCGRSKQRIAAIRDNPSIWTMDKSGGIRTIVLSGAMHFPFLEKIRPDKGSDMKGAPKNGTPPVLKSGRLSMTDVLRNSFPLFLNEKSIRSAIESICAEFGNVKSLNILPATRGTSFHCACSLRLESAAADAALKSTYQVSEHAGELHFMVDVDERWTGRTM